MTAKQLKTAIRDGNGKAILTAADLDAAVELLAKTDRVTLGRGKIQYCPWSLRRMARGATPATDLGYPAWTIVAPPVPQVGDLLVEQSPACA